VLRSQAARIGLLLGLAAVPFAPLCAQESVRVTRGDWVRIWTAASTQLEGRVWAIELDTVVITDDDRTWERSTTVGDIKQLEVRRDRGTYVATGALVGTGVGVTAGLLFALGFCGGDTLCEADEYFRIFAILVLPPITVGTLVGLAIPKREWETVPLDRLQLGLLPDPNGGGRVSLRWVF
jgi:hypothetical protein